MRLIRTYLFKFLLIAALASRVGAATAADLTIGVSLVPASLDPHLIWGPANSQLVVQMFGTLTTMDAQGKLLPRLASEWHADGDQGWIFKLDPRAKFSNGDPVHAADVIASVQRAMHITGGTYKGIFAQVDNLEAQGDATVRIHTKQAVPTLPYSMGVIAILPKAVADRAESKDFADAATSVSAGPYQMASFTPGDRLTLVPNPHFLGTPAKWAHLTFRFLPDDATRVAALLSGQVDMIDNVAPDDAEAITRRAGFKVVSKPSERTVFMSYDLSRDITPQVSGIDGKPLATNPFRDIRVRQALAYAVDRDAIVKRVLHGQGAPMSQIGGPSLGGFNANIPAVPYDPQRAKALLAQAGYPQGFRLTVTCFSGRLINDARICQALGQMLERVGMKTTVDVQPYPVLITKEVCHCERRPSFFMSTWSSSPVGEVSMATGLVLHTYDKDHSLGTWNLGEYTNPALDKRIEASLQTIDPSKRFPLLAGIMADAMKDMPILPLHLQNITLASRKGLTPTAFVNEYTIADAVSVDK
jgi:peptide/nickel transport system substrate-binding protein